MSEAVEHQPTRARVSRRAAPDRDLAVGAREKLPRIDSFIRLAGALGVEPNDLTTGIGWTPPERIIMPGAFEVPDDPELEAEVAVLRHEKT